MAVPVAERDGAPPSTAAGGPVRPSRRPLVLVALAVGVVGLAAIVFVGYRWAVRDPAPSPPRTRPNPVTVALPPPKVERVPGIPLGPDGAPLASSAQRRVEEVFIEGGARSFLPSGWWGHDGRWRVRTSEGNALYVTRLLIVRPPADAGFNGTVVLQWIGADDDPAVLRAAADRRDALVADGYAWVGVSAGPDDVSRLRSTDPERYGSLGHAGASYSYDIYSQAAKAVREPDATAPLGDLEVDRLIGASDPGEAARLVTYVNAIQQHARLFDGFLLPRRPSLAAPLTASPQRLVAMPNPSPLRRSHGAPLRVCTGDGQVEPEPPTVEQPLLDPATPAEIARTRAVMAEMGCPA